MRTTNCEKVFAILKDLKPHLNYDMIDRLGGGNFALAARIRNLKEQGYNIKSGTPQEFDKVRIKAGDWWYQLLNAKYCKPEIKPVATSEKRVHYGTAKPDKQISMDFIHKNSNELERILT